MPTPFEIAERPVNNFSVHAHTTEENIAVLECYLACLLRVVYFQGVLYTRRVPST